MNRTLERRKRTRAFRTHGSSLANLVAILARLAEEPA